MPLGEYTVPPKRRLYIGSGGHRSLDVEEKMLDLMEDPFSTLAEWHRGGALDDLGRSVLVNDPGIARAAELPDGRLRLISRDPFGHPHETQEFNVLALRTEGVQIPLDTSQGALGDDYSIAAELRPNRDVDSFDDYAHVSVPVTIVKESDVKTTHISITNDR